MRDLPGVGVFQSDAREIRAVALRSPLERMVVHALGRQRIVAVALHFVAQRADHLAVAEIAALADVDVAAREFERRVGPHALDLLDRALEIEQRHDLHEAADRDHDQDAEQQKKRVLLEDVVLREEARHLGSLPLLMFGLLIPRAAAKAATTAAASSPAAIVIQTL